MAENTVSDILLYTKEMMLAVADRRWEDLIGMQSVQDEMLKGLFAGDAMFSSQQKEDLVEVQSLNQEIIREAERHKADIANELKKMQRGKAKVGAYLSS